MRDGMELETDKGIPRGITNGVELNLEGGAVLGFFDGIELFVDGKKTMQYRLQHKNQNRSWK